MFLCAERGECAFFMGSSMKGSVCSGSRSWPYSCMGVIGMNGFYGEGEPVGILGSKS